MNTEQQPGIKIGQIFIVQAHFAHREDVFMLPSNHPIGEINFHVELKTGANEDDTAGLVVLHVTSINDNDPVYRLDIELAALVERDEKAPNLPPSEYAQMFGGGLLYPFMREAVANLTARGRFGPMWLKPLNFAASGFLLDAPEEVPPHEKTSEGP